MNAKTPWGKLSPAKPYEFFKGPAKPKTLGQFLSSKAENSSWLIEFGAVYVNRLRVIDEDHLLGTGDVIRIHTNPKRYELNRFELKNRVVCETKHYIVMDKPSGLPMHPTLDNLYENLLYAFDFPLHVTHRLDVPTSGLVLVAKTKEYQALFNKLISERRLKKHYEALVEKAVKPSELIHYMENSVKAPKVVRRESQGDGWQECRLIVHSCEAQGENLFKLSLELLTGRTHQIRCQLAFEGAPIIGDEMYGGRSHDSFGLRASSLKFNCPLEGKPLSFRLTS